MNNAKCMMLLAYCLMMSAATQAMEVEETRGCIFVWSPQDREYHVLTEHGEVSESILEKSEQERKVSKARLIIEKNKEGEIKKRYVSIETHKYGQSQMGDVSAAYGCYQRTQIPISFSSEQYTAMLNRCRDNQEDAVLVIYDHNNVYSITDICDDIHLQSKAVNIWGDKSSESASIHNYARYREIAKQAMTLVAWGAVFAVLISTLNSSTY